MWTICRKPTDEEDGEESTDLGECGEDKGFIVGYEMGMMEIGQVGVEAAEKRRAAAGTMKKLQSN